MNPSRSYPRVRLVAVTLFCIVMIAIADGIGEANLGLYGLFVITWVALMGLNIVFGHAGQFNLAQNTLYGVGAFAYGILASDGKDPWLAMLLATAVGAALGGAMTLIAGRVRGLGLAILTLGIALATPDLFSATSLTGGFNGVVGIPPLELGSQALLGNRLMVAYTVFALIIFLLTRNWLRSSWGTALRTVAADPEAAAGIGLSPLRYRTLALVIGGAITGFAGGMYGAYQGYLGYLSFPVTMVIMWYLAVILGGAGTIWGPVVGAAFITVLPENLPVSDDLHLVLWGALLVGFVVLAPQGIVAGIKQLVDRMTSRRVEEAGHGAASSARGHEMPRPDPDPDDSVAVAEIALEVDSISKRIGGLQILDDVSIRLVAGTVTALLGANGAGKSTLVNCLSGYLPPTSGRTRLKGTDVTGARPASICGHGLARTFQHPRLVDRETVFDNVLAGLHAAQRPNPWLAALPALVTTRSRRRQDTKVRSILADLGIEDLAAAPVGDLSAGSRQIVAIARSLMSEPDVLLLDEPVAGLGSAEMGHVAETIAVVAATGVAVLVIEHRLDFVRTVAQDAYCLDAGRVIASGPLDVVLADPVVRRAFLGMTDASVPAAPVSTREGGER